MEPANGFHGFFIHSLNNLLNKLLIVTKQVFVGNINPLALIL